VKVIKDFFLKQFIKSIFWITPKLSDRTIIRLTHVAEQLVPERFKKTVKYVREKWENQHPSVGLVKKILTQLNKRSRNKLAENLFVNALFIGAKKRWKFIKQHGFKPPFLLVISPTMRCNLLCKGCYAGEYTRDEDLDFETVDRIIREAKRLGVYFYTISGGEPYVWEGLFRMFKKHNDCYFQTYTNGTLLNEENAEKLAKVGNVAAAISVEGFKRETDLRRGKGVYEKVMKAMDNLRNAGVMFGFSATPTKYNSEILSSERFIDHYINKGCLFGWYFQYIPIGLKPNVDMMATPEQRLRLLKFVHWVRANKPIFIGDFWNDGPYVGGCMAGALAKDCNTGYLHINCHGDVEPCVFSHFAVDNIKDKSLLEAITSPFFKEISKQRPYVENLLRPCMIIDCPYVLRKAVKKCNARPTHPGAETIVEDKKIVRHLDNYSKRWKELTDPIWKKWKENKLDLAKEYEEEVLKKERLGKGRGRKRR